MLPEKDEPIEMYLPPFFNNLQNLANSSLSASLLFLFLVYIMTHNATFVTFRVHGLWTFAAVPDQNEGRLKEVLRKLAFLVDH